MKFVIKRSNTNERKKESNQPPYSDCLIIELSDRTFHCAPFGARVVSEQQPHPPKNQRTNVETPLDLLNVLYYLKKSRLAREKNQRHSAKVDTNIQNFDFRKLQEKQNLTIRVKQLRQELKAQMDFLEQEKQLVETKRKNLLPKVKQIAEAEVSLLASKRLLEENKQTLSKHQVLLQTISKRIMQRRWHLISSLKEIYTISPAQNQPYFMLNFVPLPNSEFVGFDEEQIAVSLGFVAHAVFMVSKYLDIPLRYPIIPMCSRSVIRDDISQQVSPKFPLYSRGVDRTRFEYAVFLLNKNIQQLLNSENLDVRYLRNILPNLSVLLSHNPELSTSKQILLDD